MNKLPTILLCLLLGGAATAAAPAPPVRPDAMAQRTAACVACHGKQGRATSEGLFPRIAGKPQGYLYNQLLHFRQGRRTNAQMNSMLAHLSDAYLNEMAGYFAAQHLPYPAPQAVRVPPQTLERGRVLVQLGDPAKGLPACVACHGQKLAGVLPAIPGLLGLPRDYLNLQLGAWKGGARRAAAPDCMADIAAKLTPEDVAAVSAWLSAQRVPSDYAPAPALAAKLPIACGSGGAV